MTKINQNKLDGSKPVEISIIAPLHNEAGNVAALASEIGTACKELGAIEIIFVNDGSTDETAIEIAHIRQQIPAVREIRHKFCCGQSAAIATGVRGAKGEICVTLDGDGQNPPAEIPKLVAALKDTQGQTVGLVAGQRVKRKDTASKRLASKFANGLRAKILRDNTRDTGCGLKAFRPEDYLRLPYFDHMHRYLPALFKREGHLIKLVDVSHRERQTGTSKYTNFGRAIVGITDLFGVWWLLHRRKLPQIDISPTPSTKPIATESKTQ